MMIQTVVPLILSCTLLVAWVVETIWRAATGRLPGQWHAHTYSHSSHEADGDADADADADAEWPNKKPMRKDSFPFSSSTALPNCGYRSSQILPTNEDALLSESSQLDDVDVEKNLCNSITRIEDEKIRIAADNEDANALAADDQQVSDKEEHYGKKYFALFVYLTYLVLPSVATTIFLAFPTINVNPSGVKGLPYADVYLTSDYRIEAGSERDKLARLWATAMIFVYPVGIPVRPLC